MNILILNNAAPLRYGGGAEKVTDMLASAFKSRGHNVVLVSSVMGGSVVPDDYVLPTTHYQLSSDSYLEEYKAIIDNHNIQYVIVQSECNWCFDVLNITPQNIKKVLVHHTMPFPMLEKERRIYLHKQKNNLKERVYSIISILFPKINRLISIRRNSQVFKTYLNVVDKLCFLSPSYIEDVTKYTNIDESRLCYIPNPVEIQDSLSMCKENILLFVGRQSHVDKNVRMFINVWSKLEQRNPSWRAILVGTGPDLERNMRYADKLNLKRIEFVGHSKNVKYFYERSKLFCMTSFYEGFPLTLVEAMAEGCVPIVLNTSGVFSDIIDDGLNGFLIKPFSQKDMVATIQNLMNDDKLLEKTSQNSLAKVLSLKDAQQVCLMWEELFKTIEERN